MGRVNGYLSLLPVGLVLAAVGLWEVNAWADPSESSWELVERELFPGLGCLAKHMTGVIARLW